MKFKTGKINFEAVIAASVAGMGYTVITNAVSNSDTIGPKWNVQKDVNYALGATVLGAGLIYFLPKTKWATPAGYGLLGAGGAVAAQVITNKIKPGGTVNGFLGDAMRKAKKLSSYTPAGLAASGLKKLINRDAACNCAPAGFRKTKLNGVTPQSYGELAAFNALGLN
jgi:hypothetical protein